MSLVDGILISIFLINILLVALYCYRDPIIRRLVRVHFARKKQLKQVLAELQQLRSETLLEDDEPLVVASPPPAVKAPVNNGFSSQMETADLKSRLKGSSNKIETPEKYKLVASLAKRGMAAKDIAEVMQLSLVETEQLIKLSAFSVDEKY